jgi:hypothetical protein
VSSPLWPPPPTSVPNRPPPTVSAPLPLHLARERLLTRPPRSVPCAKLDFRCGRRRLGGALGNVWCYSRWRAAIAAFAQSSIDSCEAHYVNPVLSPPERSLYHLDCSLGCAACEFAFVEGK